MQLLVERSQTTPVLSFTDRTKLKLWAMFEITPEENELVTAHNIRNVMLMPEKPGQWQKAMIYGAISAVLVTYILDQLFSTARGNPLIILIAGIFIFIGLTLFIYSQITHFVKVDDILTGYTFTCKNVVEFMIKEDELTSLASNFQQLLERLRTWKKKEIVKF